MAGTPAPRFIWATLKQPVAESNVEGIVLSRRNSGESDRRITLLTRDFGKIDAVAKGARKAASRLGSSTEPLSIAVFGIAAGKHANFVTQAQPVGRFSGLRSDFDRLSMALALLELVDAVAPVDQPDPEIYDLLEKSLNSLTDHPKPQVVMVWAEVRLLEASGFAPQFGQCVITGAPLSEGEAFLSPMAGGYVSAAHAPKYVDRFLARAEVLYGLDRIGHFADPPPNLKLAKECLQALFPFWRAVADKKLPANEALLNQLRDKQS